MDSLDAGVHALCTAPLGCAFLLTVEASGLEPTEAAGPEVALQIAVRADSDLVPWTGWHAEVVALVIGEGPRLAPLARSILSTDEAAWWWAPLDREAQLWTGASQKAPRWPSELSPRPGAPSEQERYSLMPDWGLLTSTAFGDVTAHLAMGAWGWRDFMPLTTIPRRRYAAATSARVYEVHSAHDWHNLVATYPAAERGSTRNKVPGDRPDQVVPDWSAVAHDWDGVHLSFGGLLTTLYVWAEGPTGPTRNWSWDIEGTWWLRWCFDEVEDLSERTEIPAQDARLRGAVMWPMPGVPGRESFSVWRSQAPNGFTG